MVTAAQAIEQLQASAKKGELIVVLGAGVSVALTDRKAPTWLGLMKNGLAYCRTKGIFDETVQKAQLGLLDTGDFDCMLGVAEFIAKKLGGSGNALYARWLQEEFASLSATNDAMVTTFRALQKAGIPIATLNYDHLLENLTGLEPLLMDDATAVTKWLKGERQAILHLHGSFEKPSSCVFSISDYKDTQAEASRQFFQQVLGGVKHLLFIGCGETLADPNLSQLVKWLNQEMPAAAKLHYGLVKADEMAARHADSNWHGFLEPLSYGEQYDDLPAFLTQHFGTSCVASLPANKKSPAKRSNISEKHAKLLDSYRQFLLKNCGQMSIEGVGCDFNAGQQRFDLEKLFVPVKLQACPPELPLHDEAREEKLRAWQAKNEEPQAFSRVFTDHQRLVLLALPGAGKTMLLQRLAVAYASPTRLKQSQDDLPELPLTPVMLRCREWRAHIKQPILSLLKNLGDITGEANLQGLNGALLPLLKKGQILLLVDGLDEIHDDGARATFVQNLEAFIDQFPNIRVVITSREAGFQLIAPTLLRFCQRWRVAPLDEEAMQDLCRHWYALMHASSAERLQEAAQLAQDLWQNDALRRLAENPLLLTMLLVVKQGMSRLPANRVSLYGRAVEVLLDTWNIKGHEALNAKEAVPQLAFIALCMMREGKQTATESELLAYLEQARTVHRIQMYVKDTPDFFLKRVELRSSLLMEAGRQMEGGKSVPFFQFRHLTFQEYLAAVAVSEKYYGEVGKKDTVLTPLKPHLRDEKWKEVIPMAAVMAGQYAEPLLAELLKQSQVIHEKFLAGKSFEGKDAWLRISSTLPRPIALLVQCLSEEAQATPETLAAALQLIPVFAKAFLSRTDWSSLCSGPYGKQLLHQTCLLFASLNWRVESKVLDTYAQFAYWHYAMENSSILAQLQTSLASTELETITTGLMACRGFALLENANLFPLLPQIEQHLFHAEPSVVLAAVDAWGGLQAFSNNMKQSTQTVLDRLLILLFDERLACAIQQITFALFSQIGHERSRWQPRLSAEQVTIVQEITEKFHGFVKIGLCVLAFHAKNVWTEDELAARLSENKQLLPPRWKAKINAMLQQMGEVGQKYLLDEAQNIE